MKFSPLDVEDLEAFFKENHTYLCLVALAIVRDGDVAKDIVQDFFISYWEKRKSVKFTVSFKAYAVKAVRNLSLQHLRKVKRQELLVEHLTYGDKAENEAQESLGNRQKLHELLQRLPESRRKIFISYVIYGQSYSEIAENNGISINTVKTQMKRAYGFLRSEANPDILYFLFLSVLPMG
ncbi:RNA polymerase sigma-70 factor [Pseudozobellia thermophila]|uniref:RNA polymerase sigma-70 factor, ECF subfamily n=1 Tax=Pseudozobellia thermophila TaxID=192903 RepID=A0A1M6KDJ8_9FLAO|nr:RNA polymerase sigma-70 factor [Pseudozobellia thermophila]SHJ57025.1 RNA polymerase sigma-70 factor, ECF subfamily [Pseudozobellia thermophila]